MSEQDGIDDNEIVENVQFMCQWVRFCEDFTTLPQAIVKPKPLARSVGNINLSTQAYQYLITA